MAAAQLLYHDEAIQNMDRVNDENKMVINVDDKITITLKKNRKNICIQKGSNSISVDIKSWTNICEMQYGVGLVHAYMNANKRRA